VGMPLDDKIRQLSEEVELLLLKQHKRVAVVETTSSGGLSYALTDRANSAEWFNQGYVIKSINNLLTLFDLEPSSANAENFPVNIGEQISTRLFSRFAIDIVMMNFGGHYLANQQFDKQVYLLWTVKGNSTVIAKTDFSGTYTDIRKEIILQSLQGLINILQENL
jgi:nicotinamide mononucleotide (NMN) deamidase PncC